MNPIKIKKLDHVVLLVTNIKKSIHFYRDVLGCVETRVSKNLYQYQAGISMIDLVPREHAERLSNPTSKNNSANMDHFALTLENFDEKAIVAYLEDNDIKVELSGRRFGAEGYGPSIYCRDPDGNFVELKGPSELLSNGN
ncbi:MAG: VOC family virulence protein [Rhodospirillales bacterium]|nr:VOC family virulence protein [Rhodospirillales bacterium]|tara:strand:- start:55 stop:474 length:420 start_codon:yes stop_codon:yes gene_type:complete